MCFLGCLHSNHLNKNSTLKCKQSWGRHCLLQIKALTTNWYMTLAGAAYSDLLEVNDECTKVRRIKPLPKWLLCSPTSKLLLAWNLSEMQTEEDGAARGLEHLSLSKRILQKFGAHGSVTSFWILHPGKELPKELQCYAKRYKELSQHLSAVVKFESLEAVRKAYNALKAEEEKSKGKGVCVVPLGFQSKHHNNKDESSEERSEDQPWDTPSQENPFETSEDSVQEELSSPVRVSDKIPDTSQTQNTLKSSFQRTLEQIPTTSSSQTFSGFTQRYSRLSSGDCNKESSHNPWVLRCKLAARALNHKAAGHLSTADAVQQVLRRPLGPDDSRGFHGRGKLLQKEVIKVSLRHPGRTTCAEYQW